MNPGTDRSKGVFIGWFDAGSRFVVGLAHPHRIAVCAMAQCVIA
jgi:hypothetical protein